MTTVYLLTGFPKSVLVTLGFQNSNMPKSACHFLERIDRKSYTYLEERHFRRPALFLPRPTRAGETATKRDSDFVYLVSHGVVVINASSPP